MSKEADSLDIDGLLVKRQFPIQSGAIGARRRHGLAIYDRALVFPEITRSVELGEIGSLREAISFYLHSRRGVRNDVVESLNLRGTDKFGNTGRSDKKPWVDMTWKQLNSMGLDGLRDIFFTPRGFKTVESKGAGIQELVKKYDQVTHFDDDPLTTLLLARHFVMVNFVLAGDLSAGYLLKDVNMNDYPNVRWAKRIRDI